MVVYPGSIQVAYFAHKHKVFLNQMREDTVTFSLPPAFIWADGSRLSGTWCVEATTYHTNPDIWATMQQVMRARLIP